MHLQDYLQIVRKRWWIIVLIGLTAATTAYVFSKLQTPVYRSQAVYSVVINRVDSGAFNNVNKALNSYINRVYNRDTFQLIIQQLQLDVPVERLLKDVRMQGRDDLTITIEADSPNPDDPPRIINAVGDALLANVAEINRTAEGVDRIIVQRQSPAPVFKAKPLTKINVLAGGLLGAILGVLLAFILEYLDDTLKTASDVERYTELVTVGAIPSGAALGGRMRPRLRAAPTSGIITQGPAQPRNTIHDD